ncbi:hypothetical protein, partial [Acinetobacter indicus]|uniref:hypothetical protein n=1 Tax=Acinetobacter indicus TaxID=756892 RepID=UPI001C0A0014
MTLKLPVESLPWIRPGLNFFRDAPKNAELGVEEPELDPCKPKGTVLTAPTAEMAVAIGLN